MSQRYLVKGKIAEGGLGEVYLARDARLDRDVALKRVRPPDGEGAAAALEQDLLREARTLSALQHPNIVTIYDVGRDEKGPFVVMEYLNGETLDDVIARGALSVEDFTEVVVQSLEGMIAAQSLGLVHRDLKPGNLMIVRLATGKFQVKILDFGLAKFSQIATRQTEDQGAAIMGSIFFMAPEQFERRPLDGRTDLYSLGCVYYQILTTRHPFDGETGRDVMVSHLQHHVRPLAEARPDVPEWMAAWVMRLISLDMENRPPDARAALDDFRAARAEAERAKTKTQSVPPVRIVGRGTGPGGVTAGATRSPAVAGTRKSSGKTMKKPVKRTKRHASHSSGGGGKWLLILLPLLLIGGGAAWYASEQKKKTPAVDETSVLKELAAQKSPLVNTSTLDAVFAAIRRGGEDAKTAGGILKRMKGAQIPAAVARELEKTSGTGPERILLMEAVATHPSRMGTAALLKAAENSTGPVLAAALEAIGKAGDADDVPAFLRLLEKIQDPVNREKFFASLRELQAKLKDPEMAVDQLVTALDEASPAMRTELLQLLSRTGHPRASVAAVKELEAGGERRETLLSFLPDWLAPDARLADNLLQTLQDDESSRDGLLPLYINLAPRVPTWTAEEIVLRLRAVQDWAFASDKAQEALAVVLENTPGPDALAYIEELSKSESEIASAIGTRVAAAHPTIQERLVKLEAGPNTLDASKATVHSAGRDAYYNATANILTGWRQPSTRVSWDIELSAPGEVEVTVFQSTDSPPADETEQVAGRFRVRLASAAEEAPVKYTNSASSFLQIEAGKFRIPHAGIWRLWLEPVQFSKDRPLMNVQKISLNLKQ